MNSSSPKPSFLILCGAIPVVLGASSFGLRGHGWTAALAVCSLAALTMPVVRSLAKAAEGMRPMPGIAAAHDAVLWEAEVLCPPGQPATFRITGVRGNTEDTLGHAAEQWLVDPKFWPAHIAVEDRERVLKACHSAIQQGQENLRVEYRVSNAQGPPIWIEDSVQVLRAWGGRPRKLRGRMVNVTKQKQAAEILRQSQKMEEVGRLVGGVVHDFNNLLTVIGGHADLVLMSMDPMDPRRSSIEEIRKAEGRAAALARQLLALSRRHPVSPELLDLGSVVGNLGKMLGRLISEDIELVTFPQTGLGHVFADAGQIEQVIINLVVNARDAMPTGGRLVIETGVCDVHEPLARSLVPPGRYITLAVSDTGCGMDAATQSRIFEPFFTTKEPGKGTGLGLATVQEIVHERQGYIEVESEVGKGTTFRIYFPRTELAAAACLAPAAAAGARHGSETILVVEDEDNVRAMARQLLGAYGYQVLESASGEEALRLVEQHTGPVDLLLTDVVMPRMNGHDLGEMLRSRHPGLKLLYMSGYSRDAMLQHAVIEPETPYVQKPFTPQTMAAAVRRALDGERELQLSVSEPAPSRFRAPGSRPN
jgi:two-component system, cell cycle sensor histidine kinase and response regulator CckA